MDMHSLRCSLSSWPSWPRFRSSSCGWPQPTRASATVMDLWCAPALDVWIGICGGQRWDIEGDPVQDQLINTQRLDGCVHDARGDHSNCFAETACHLALPRVPWPPRKAVRNGPYGASRMPWGLSKVFRDPVRTASFVGIAVAHDAVDEVPGPGQCAVSPAW